MKKNTDLLQPDTFYHIYNRGINGETIFREERNYRYFLQRYARYIEPIADTYAYCLLNNHFHLLIRTKSEDEILTGLRANKEKPVSFYLGNQFAKLFNSFCQATNSARGRTGGLFETPFRRIAVNTDAYFSQLIAYIHFNPQKHGFVKDFKRYPYSSYFSHLLTKPTRLMRQEVLEWFSGAEGYVKFHQDQLDERTISHLIIEAD